MKHVLVGSLALSFLVGPSLMAGASACSGEGELLPGATEVAIEAEAGAPGVAAASDDELRGPGAALVDEFHPNRKTAVEPAFGGTVTVHLESMPKSLAYPIQPSGVTRDMLYEVHEFLVQQNWETWELEGRLADSWTQEDTLVLKGGRTPENGNLYYGDVREDGDAYVVTPHSQGNPLKEAKRVPKADVERWDKQTVFTFKLHPGVKWHDGHVLDAEDVLFSWSIYYNPQVDCDSFRDYFTNVVHAEVVDGLTVRFFYGEQYFKALENLGDICVMPRHLYDLTDPDCADYDPKADEGKVARYINENPHNRQWVGLGAYQVTKFEGNEVVADRFNDYFRRKEEPGYFDRIRWLNIDADETAFQALINQELDFYGRVTSEAYFGSATTDAVFTRNFYKGNFYAGRYSYYAWNSKRPQLSDPVVRKALAHCMDWDEYKATILRGLGTLVTGPQFCFGPAYNQDVKPLKFDLELAEEMLAESGWYDRDGDGIIDKDGVAFEIDFLATPGNKASELFIQRYQESVSKVGIKINVKVLEWASLLDKVLDKDFDMVGLSWSQPIPESDPNQLWHSRGAAPDARGSNHASVADPYIDELIQKGRTELDNAKRYAIWKEFHRYLYEEIQPYLFGFNTPKKFALNKKIRGFQAFAITPGYYIRRWYYPAGTPGTRPTLQK